MPILTLLNRVQRQGTAISASTPSPVGPLAGKVEIRALMDAADIADPTNQLRLFIEASEDGGQTWRTLVGTTWGGGVRGRDGAFVAPRVRVTLPAAMLLRGWVDSLRRQRIGVEIVY
jgi:hypothetical protein